MDKKKDLNTPESLVSFNLLEEVEKLNDCMSRAGRSYMREQLQRSVAGALDPEEKNISEPSTSSIDAKIIQQRNEASELIESLKELGVSPETFDEIRTRHPILASQLPKKTSTSSGKCSKLGKAEESQEDESYSISSTEDLQQLLEKQQEETEELRGRCKKMLNLLTNQSNQVALLTQKMTKLEEQTPSKTSSSSTEKKSDSIDDPDPSMMLLHRQLQEWPLGLQGLLRNSAVGSIASTEKKSDNIDYPKNPSMMPLHLRELLENPAVSSIASTEKKSDTVDYSKQRSKRARGADTRHGNTDSRYRFPSLSDLSERKKILGIDDSSKRARGADTRRGDIDSSMTQHRTPLSHRSFYHSVQRAFADDAKSERKPHKASARHKPEKHGKHDSLEFRKEAEKSKKKSRASLSEVNM